MAVPASAVGLHPAHARQAPMQVMPAPRMHHLPPGTTFVMSAHGAQPPPMPGAPPAHHPPPAALDPNAMAQQQLWQAAHHPHGVILGMPGPAMHALHPHQGLPSGGMRQTAASPRDAAADGAGSGGGAGNDVPVPPPVAPAFAGGGGAFPPQHGELPFPL